MVRKEYEYYEDSQAGAASRKHDLVGHSRALGSGVVLTLVYAAWQKLDQLQRAYKALGY